jgi:glycosyltransferase involved in cell wall biosynthesis
VLSIVVPVFNEEDSLPELHRRLHDVLDPIGEWEVVYVDDGSTDGSGVFVEGLAQDEEGVVLVQLSRNFGMEVAMSAGIDHAMGDRVVLLHADLQDPPELIPQMVELADAGADVVYARRIGRDESWLKRRLATVFYRLMERLARVPYQGQAGDFRLMSERVVDAVRRMPERRRFVRGMVAWAGFEQVPVEYKRAGRTHGPGASYPELFRLAAEALAAYSDVPLSLATIAGIGVAALGGVAAVVIAVLAAAGALELSISLAVLLAVLCLGGVQLISVGIIGRYLARVHEESLRRPLYLVSRVAGAERGRPSEPSPAPDRDVGSNS